MLLVTLATACGEPEGASPQTVQERVQSTLPGLIDSTSSSAAFLGESEQWSSFLASFEAFDAVAGPIFGADEESTGEPLPAAGDEDLSGQQIADMLVQELFNADNYLGGGDFAIPGELVCASAEDASAEPPLPGEPTPEPVEQEINQECLDTLAEIDPRVHVETAGSGLDFVLVVGPDRAAPATLELRSDRISLAADLAEARAAALHIASVTGEELELPTLMQGVSAATLRVNGPSDVSFEVAIREQLQVAGDTDAGPLSLSLDAADPMFSLRLNGPAQELTAQMDIRRTQLTMPWELFNEAGAATTFDLDWHGLSTTLVLSAEEDGIVFENIGFGDEQSTIKLDGETIFSLDLNADAGRRLELLVGDGASGLPNFEFDPKMSLDLFFDLSPLADAGDEVPPYLLGESYSIDIDGSAPTIRPVGGAVEGALEVVSGEMRITSSTGTGDILVPAGQCLLSSELQPGEHELLGLLSAGSCPQ